MSPNNPNRSLPLSALIGNAIQIREGLLTDVVARYAEQMVIFGDTVVNHQGDAWPVLAVFEDADGVLHLADGSHRAHAALKIGAVMMQCRVRKGSKVDALRYALGANAKHGHPLSNADKRRAAELALLDPVWTVRSNAAIAADIGCSAPLVASVRAGLETAGKAQAAAARRGADGKLYPVRPAPAIEREEVKTVLTSTVPEGEQVSVEDVLAAQAQADEERAASRAAISRTVAQVVTPASLKAAGVPVGAVLDPGAHQSRDDVSSAEQVAEAKRIKQVQRDSWSTPPEFIDQIVRPLLGKIDMDPASNAAAQEVVQAKRWIGAEEDGLAQEWKGSVWLNPPYSFPLVERFADKALEEWEARRVSNMMILVNSSTSSAWWHRLSKACSLLTFPGQRIQFWSPHELEGDANRNASTLFCFTRNKETDWMMSLRKHGFVVYRNTLA